MFINPYKFWENHDGIPNKIIFTFSLFYSSFDFFYFAIVANGAKKASIEDDDDDFVTSSTKTKTSGKPDFQDAIDLESGGRNHLVFGSDTRCHM